MFRFNKTIIREPTVCFAKVTVLVSVKIIRYWTVRSCGRILCGHTTEQWVKQRKLRKCGVQNFPLRWISKSLLLEYQTAYFGTCLTTTMYHVPQRHDISPFNLTTYDLCSSKTVLALWLHLKLLANFCGRFFFGVSAVQLRHHTHIV